MSDKTLSGTPGYTLTVYYENNNLGPELRCGARYKGPHMKSGKITIPEGQTLGRISDEAMSYGDKFDRTCADIVITTHLQDAFKSPAVLTSLRGPNESFPEKWWMYGGGVFGYMDELDFIKNRAEAECGVEPIIQGIIGHYQTCCDVKVCSTTQRCYIGYVPYEKLQSGKHVDENHTDTRIVTRKNLSVIPASQQHVYPMRVFKLALDAMEF